MLPVDSSAEKAKCEDLEKIVVGDYSELFFSGWGSVTSLEERRAGRVS